jgi:hypothetical protein
MLPAEHAVDVPLVVPAPAVPRRRAESRQFYVWMAYACAFIAFAGFTPTYWAPVASRSFDGPPILHLHGLLFSAWTLLFVAQARFAAAGRFEHHRALGLIGISLATAMLFAGITVAVASIEAGVARGVGEQARAFSIVPITIILSFAVIVAVALANIRRPDVHMRLMLVAAISVLPPAIARIVFLLLAPPGAGPGMGNTPPLVMTLVPGAVSDVLLLVAILYDWRTRGRPHRAYVIAGVAIVVLQIVRLPLARTAAWHAVTDWLLRFS